MLKYIILPFLIARASLYVSANLQLVMLSAIIKFIWFSMIDLKSITVDQTVIRLKDDDLKGEFSQRFNQTVMKAPRLFQEANVVLDLSLLTSELTTSVLNEIKRSIYATGASLLGVLDPHNNYKDILRRCDLSRVYQRTKRSSANVESTGVVNSIRFEPFLRSGAQVYARSQNLCVLGHVARGAEAIADGHIIVLGNLLGKAIAGAAGQSDAVIFCHRFAAELIAIAGIYALNEDLHIAADKPSVIQVNDGKLSASLAQDYRLWLGV